MTDFLSLLEHFQPVALSGNLGNNGLRRSYAISV